MLFQSLVLQKLIKPHLDLNAMCCGLDWVSLTPILLFFNVTPSRWLSQESKQTSLVTSEDEGVLFCQRRLQCFYYYPFGLRRQLFFCHLPRTEKI